MERTVLVWDRPHKVQVYQKSKAVWVATGDYMGRNLLTTDRTAEYALRRWKEAATARGG